jgi:chromate reductase
VTKILGISGSLRERSYNTALLRAAAELAPPDAEIELFDLAAIPLYNDDVESAGDPEPVAALRAAVAEADALLLATPEYNRGTSGVLKNAIDWLSRPALASVLRWKPVAIMGASSGRGGTRRAQRQVRDALLFPGAIVLEQPEVAVPIAWERRKHRRRADRAAVRSRPAGSSEPARRGLGPPLNPDCAAQDVAERPLVCSRKGCDRRRRLGHDLEDALAQPLAFGRQRECLHAPIAGIGLTLGEALAFEPVRERGHVRGVAEEHVSQLTHRAGPVRLE